MAPALLANVPAGQSPQLALPGALLKCPAVQAVQAACPSDEKVPDGHAVQLAASSLAWVPARQVVQVVPGVGPDAVPAMQTEQSLDPSAE